MAFYNPVPAPDGFRHCPRCQTVKPLADFEPTRHWACGITQSCHLCLVAGREERADVRQIVEEAAARMQEIQFRSTPATSTPRRRAEPSERLTDEYFRSLDAARRRKRLGIYQ